MSRYTEELWRDIVECDECGRRLILAQYGEDETPDDDGALPDGWVEWTRPPDPRGDWPESSPFYPGWRDIDYSFCCKEHLKAFKAAHPPKVQSPTYAEYSARPKSGIQATGMWPPW